MPNILSDIDTYINGLKGRQKERCRSHFNGLIELIPKSSSKLERFKRQLDIVINQDPNGKKSKASYPGGYVKHLKQLRNKISDNEINISQLRAILKEKKEEEESTDLSPFQQLPAEMKTLILSYLATDIKALSAASSVNKLLRTLVSKDQVLQKTLQQALREAKYKKLVKEYFPRFFNDYEKKSKMPGASSSYWYQTVKELEEKHKREFKKRFPDLFPEFLKQSESPSVSPVFWIQAYKREVEISKKVGYVLTNRLWLDSKGAKEGREWIRNLSGSMGLNLRSKAEWSDEGWEWLFQRFFPHQYVQMQHRFQARKSDVTRKTKQGSYSERIDWRTAIENELKNIEYGYRTVAGGAYKFHRAVMSGDFFILKNLLENFQPKSHLKRNINCKNKLGTPLEIAASRGYLNEAVMLLNHGAHYTETSLLNAIKHGHFAMVKLFLDCGESVTPMALNNACSKGKGKIVGLLLQKEQINVSHPKNSRRFLVAAFNGRSELAIITLIKNGADPATVIGENNITPFFVACNHGYEKVIKYLLNQERIDIAAKTASGETALYAACVRGHKQIARMLIAKGAEPDEKLKSNSEAFALYNRAKKLYEEVKESQVSSSSSTLFSTSAATSSPEAIAPDMAAPKGRRDKGKGKEIIEDEFEVIPHRQSPRAGRRD